MRLRALHGDPGSGEEQAQPFGRLGAAVGIAGEGDAAELHPLGRELRDSDRHVTLLHRRDPSLACLLISLHLSSWVPDRTRPRSPAGPSANSPSDGGSFVPAGIPAVAPFHSGFILAQSGTVRSDHTTISRVFRPEEPGVSDLHARAW